MDDKGVNENRHPELNPQLLEFHKISERELKAVWRVYEEGCLATVILEFDQVSLLAEAQPADDTLAFKVISNEHNFPGRINAGNSVPWNEFVGMKFGWGWVVINQQDALDGILLSFDGITPQVLLTVVASSINESGIRNYVVTSGQTG